jgi:SAM-dependent methyltransferase
MWELITGEALFDEVSTVCGDLSLLTKIFIAFFCLFGIAALVMTAISLVSMIITGSPFIATPKNLTRKILSLANIRPGDIVYDLGCGDGRFLIEANKSYGAKAIGIEISPIVCWLAKINVWLKRADVHIHRANFQKFDFFDADVIFCYLVPDQLAILANRLRKIQKECRIISRRFEIPGWETQQHAIIRKRFGSESVFIYKISDL